jgi:hypothetical protein
VHRIGHYATVIGVTMVVLIFATEVASAKRSSAGRTDRVAVGLLVYCEELRSRQLVDLLCSSAHEVLGSFRDRACS